MSETQMRKAVVLLSGGLDSATCLAMARAEGFECYALSFRYGQRHEREIGAAGNIARAVGVARHVVQNIDLAVFGGSSLTTDEPIPKDREIQGEDHRIPSTYVPARNTIFLSFALAFAETLESTDIFIGVNAVDYSGYPDCRPEFIESFEKTARLATRLGVQDGRAFRIHTPLIHLTKAEIIRAGTSLGVDYSLTHSCYDPAIDGRSCGRCDSCLLRLKGFAEAGIPDPIAYVK